MRIFIVLLIMICILLNVAYAFEEHNIIKSVNDEYLLNCDSIKVDSKGNVFLLNNASNPQSIHVYSKEGLFKYLLKIVTRSSVQITIDNNDRLLIGFNQRDEIVVMDNDGNYLYEMPSDSINNYSKFFLNRNDIDSNGNVYRIEKMLGYYIISITNGETKRRFLSMSTVEWNYKAWTSVGIIFCVLIGISAIIAFMISNFSKFRKMELKFLPSYLIWIMSLHKKNNKKSFGYKYIELNFYRNSFWTKIVIYLWLLLFVTINLSNAEKLGFMDKGFEYNVILLYTTTIIIILTLSIILLRFIAGKFIKRTGAPDECQKCIKKEPDRWTFAMTVYGKIKCHFCGKTYTEMFMHQRLIRYIVSGILTVLLALLVHSMIGHIEIGIRIALLAGWAIAAWHFFNVIVNAIGYKKTIIEEFEPRKNILM